MMNPAEFANIAKSEKEFWWYRGMRTILFALLDPYLLDPYLARRPVRRVLDAGCGTGYFASLCRERYGCAVYPADMAPEGLAWGRKLGLERLTQADLRTLPFHTGAFDLVMSFDALVHLERGDEEAAMREMARVLAPGGICVLRAAALDILRSRHSRHAAEKQRFTRPSLESLMQRHGINVLRSTYANFLLLPVALARFRIWEPLLRRPVASGVQPIAPWLDRLLYAALALEARWLARGRSFPIGQSIVLIGEKSRGA